MINKIKYFVIVAFVFLCASCNQSGTTSNAKLIKKTVISIDAMTYTFDEVKRGDVVSANFTIRNIGRDTLYVLERFKSCTCTSASLSSNFAIPGDSIILKMILNTSKRHKGFNSVYSGVKLNTEQAFYKFTLKGYVTD